MTRFLTTRRARSRTPVAPADRRRRMVGAGLATGLALACVVAFPQAASAYTLQTTPNCATLTFSAPPRILIHYTEFKGDFFELLKTIDAVMDVNDQFNLVGATSAAVTTVQSVPDAFVFGNWFNDAVPTIHVGFGPDGALAIKVRLVY